MKRRQLATELAILAKQKHELDRRRAEIRAREEITENPVLAVPAIRVPVAPELEEKSLTFWEKVKRALGT